jgi:hypothetical protein
MTKAEKEQLVRERAAELESAGVEMDPQYLATLISIFWEGLFKETGHNTDEIASRIEETYQHKLSPYEAVKIMAEARSLNSALKRIALLSGIAEDGKQTFQVGDSRITLNRKEAAKLPYTGFKGSATVTDVDGKSHRVKTAPCGSRHCRCALEFA